jgi:hypothetical protein
LQCTGEKKNEIFISENIKSSVELLFCLLACI